MDCQAVCRAKAIRVDRTGLTIDTSLCTDCLLCVAACPTQAIAAEGPPFARTLSALQEAQSPVLGCFVRPKGQAHARTGCLGWLSDEHLALLRLQLTSDLQLNLTECSACPNEFVASELKQRIGRVESQLPGEPSAALLPILNRTDLRYQDVAFSRRSFFRAFGALARQRTFDSLDAFLSSEQTTAYGDKVLPARRKLLNMSLAAVSSQRRRELLQSFYFRIETNGNCDRCGVCVGICPTGVLRVVHDPVSKLVYRSSDCIGCGLCSEVCSQAAVAVHRGFPQDDPFVFLPCHSKLEQEVVS